jgi:hypothetical protein
VADKRVAVSTISDAIYLESTSYETDGWIVTPFGDFFASLAMQWHEAIFSGIVPDGTSLRLYVVDDTSYLTFFPTDPFNFGAFFRSVATLNKSGEIRSGINVSSTALAAQIRLRSTDPNATPTQQNVSLHAYPPVGDFLFQIPINVSDIVRRPGKSNVRIPGFGNAVYTVLRSFYKGIVEVETLREPFERIRGVVERVSAPAETNAYGGSRMRVATLIVRGRPSSDLAAAGSGSYGTPQIYGLVLYGGESLE